MANYLTLLDYENNKVVTDIDLDNLEDVFMIEITVITGDEHVRVIYKDGHSKYAAACYASADFCDGSYSVYNPGQGIDLTKNEKFINRKTSYDFMYEFD